VTRLRGTAAAILVITLSGCVVLESTYEEEKSRREVAEAELDVQQQRVQHLARDVRELEAQVERSTLEGESLGQERASLLNELEDLRQNLERSEVELEQERQLRQEHAEAIEEIKGSYGNLIDQLEGEVAKGAIEIHRLRGRLQIRALEQILFPSGSANAKPEGRVLLAKIAEQLREQKGHWIRVEGHTDSVPISTPRFPSNWELSSARAVHVVRFLIEQGLDPLRVSAAAYGPYRPIADNDTDEGRARNRRIEIVLVPEDEE
jgi:chemotaxis protein MotB